MSGESMLRTLLSLHEAMTARERALVDVYHVAPLPRAPGAPEGADYVELLIVLPHSLLPKISATLAAEGLGRGVEIREAESFERGLRPAYFHRCVPIDLERETAPARELEGARRADAARIAEERRRSLEALRVLIVTVDCDLGRTLSTSIRAVYPDAEVPVEGIVERAWSHATPRVDAIIVDCGLPDWGAVRFVDWVQGRLPNDCVALVVTDEASGPSRLLLARGFQALRGGDIAHLLAAACARNAARKLADRVESS